MSTTHTVLGSVLAWDAFAQALLPTLKPGTIIALSGPLGAGKTTFVQALARALGVRQEPTSPTFSLVRTYKTKHPSIKKLVHVDAYRLENEQEVMTLGLEDLLQEKGVMMCIEWPERVETWLQDKTNVIHATISGASDDHRTITYNKNAST